MDDYDREFDEAVKAAARHRRNVIGGVQVVAGALTTGLGAAVWWFLPPVEDVQMRLASRYTLLILGLVLLGIGLRTIFKGETELPDLHKF